LDLSRIFNVRVRKTAKNLVNIPINIKSYTIQILYYISKIYVLIYNKYFK